MNLALLKTEMDAAAVAAEAVWKKHTQAAQAYVEKDKDDKVVVTGRLLTDDEKKEIQGAIDKANGLKAQLERAKGDESMAAEIERMTAGMAQRQTDNKPDPNAQQRHEFKSLGQQWAESASGKFFFDKRHHGSRQWQSPSSELHATTFTTADGSGGDLIVPMYVPGVVDLRYKPLMVRDLIASGRTESPIIKYMKETTFTNAAAMVAEGGTKPESALVYDIVTDEVEKCAHWLPVTEEALEDIAQIRSIIDARLRLGLDLVIDDQLLNGDGTSPNISGILDRVGLATAVAKGADTVPDAIFKQMTAIFTTAWVPPDGIAMHPTNWQTVQLMKDANGQYYGAGPFSTAQRPTLWGLPVAITTTIAAGTGLVGAFKSASQWFSKGGVRVEASNSHSDYFIKNLVAIRAEERLALAVYRPGAFGTVTGL